jgi:predicted peptidase
MERGIMKGKSPLSLLRLVLSLSIAVLLAGCASKPPVPKVAYPTPPKTSESGQHPYSSKVRCGNALFFFGPTIQINYLLYLPDDYGKDPAKKWPLILFLHGYGERGSNLELLKKHPLPKFFDSHSDFPFIVVSPQLPIELEPWSELIEPLKALVERIKTKYAVDRRRVYLTGLSMGGAGTWEFGLRYPQFFAALVPIAGFYHYQTHEVPPNIAVLRDVPIWAFHGASDTSVPPYQSEILVKALKDLGSNIRFTLYPDTQHEGSWIRAYADPELYEWMGAQRLK